MVLNILQSFKSDPQIHNYSISQKSLIIFFPRIRFIIHPNLISNKFRLVHFQIFILHKESLTILLYSLHQDNFIFLFLCNLIFIYYLIINLKIENLFLFYVILFFFQHPSLFLHKNKPHLPFLLLIHMHIIFIPFNKFSLFTTGVTSAIPN